MSADDWRIIVLSIGAFDIFVALFLVLSVLTGIFPTGRTHKSHVLLIGISYILLATSTWLAIAGRAISHAPLSWRLPLASVAFPLGIIALWQLIRKH